jgi:hypothetical protein
VLDLPLIIDIPSSKLASTLLGVCYSIASVTRVFHLTFFQSKCHPCRRSREAQRRDAADLREPAVCSQDPEVRRCTLDSYINYENQVFTHILQVVELDHSYRERVHNYQLHTYMYGQVIEAPPGVSSATLGGETMTDLVLSPSSTVISFDDLTIYRIGEGTPFALALCKSFCLLNSWHQKPWHLPLLFLSVGHV